LRDGRARDRLAYSIRLLSCFKNLNRVSDDLSDWDAVCWCAASILVQEQALLSALVDVTAAGDDEPMALPDRQFVAEIRALTNARGEA
jgi:hypothetical protein